MGYIRLGIPESLVVELLRARPTPNFVETGTFRGGTAFWAAKHFANVVTIELNPALSNAVATRPDCPTNIEFLVGDSAVLLPDVVKRLNGTAVFWLDGHYCGPQTGDLASECPVMAELEALRNAPGAIVLIDDARYFFGPPPPPHNPNHWPSIDQIFVYFGEHFPNHVVTVHDDVIIAVPRHLKFVLDEDWLRDFDKRHVPPKPVYRPLFMRAVGKLRRIIVG